MQTRMSCGLGLVLAISLSIGCTHYWGGAKKGEVHFSDFMSSLGPDVPIDIILREAGQPKNTYEFDDTYDVYLFHLIDNSAWDGIPGPTSEAGIALLVDRAEKRVRDVKVTFEREIRYGGWQAFMRGLAEGSYRSKTIICSTTATSIGTTTTASTVCSGW